MKKLISFPVFFRLLFLLYCHAMAEVPQMINYQGKLTNASGAPVNDTIQMVFTIYADSNGTTPLWTETQSAVVVEKGVFNVLLGSVDSIPYSVFDGSIRYLEVQVGGDPEITPRKPMVSVAYAFHSSTSDTAHFSTKSAVRAYLNGSYDLPSSVVVTVPFDRKTFDTQNEFDTSSHRFTAKQSGKYLVRATLLWQPSNASNISVRIHKNGYAVTIMEWWHTDNRICAHVEDILELSSGDYVEIAVEVDGTGGYLVGTSEGTFLFVHKLS